MTHAAAGSRRRASHASPTGHPAWEPLSWQDVLTAGTVLWIMPGQPTPTVRIDLDTETAAVVNGGDPTADPVTACALEEARFWLKRRAAERSRMTEMAQRDPLIGLNLCQCDIDQARWLLKQMNGVEQSSLWHALDLLGRALDQLEAARTELRTRHPKK